MKINPNRIKECQEMIQILKTNAMDIRSYKTQTVIKGVSCDSFLFVMDEVSKLLNYMRGKEE